MNVQTNLHRATRVHVIDCDEVARPGDAERPDGLYVTRVIITTTDGSTYTLVVFGSKPGTPPEVTHTGGTRV